MTNLTKPLPEKWELNKLLLPAKQYKYFDRWQQHPFQANSHEHSAVNAWWLAECALLAYETEAVVKNTLKDVEQFSKEGDLNFQWLNNESTQGFILEADDFILLSVRGTEFYSYQDITKDPMKIFSIVKDLRADAKLNLRPLPDQGNNDIQVVQGFYTEFNNIRIQVENFIASANKPIWLTGHSLGACIVTLMAFYQGQKKIAGIYTYGSPCIGNQNFANEFNRRELNRLCFRYVNGNDLVAKALPFWRTLFGFPKFKHVGIEKKLASRWMFLNRFMPLDMVDHAPIYYALKC